MTISIEPGAIEMHAATQDEIRTWLEKGVADGATHLIVAVDGWDQDSYQGSIA